MEVELAVLADAANLTSTGKLNVLGIFDRLTLSPPWPAVSATFSVVVRIATHASEQGKHDLTLRLADEDGREIAKLQGEFEVRRKKPSPKPTRVPIIVPSQMKFPSAGDYVIDVLINGRWEKAIEFEVRESKQ